MLQVSHSQQLVFSMFVFEALLLTFATTPTVSFLYPPRLRTRASVTGPSFANIRDRKDNESGTDNRIKQGDESVCKHRFTVVLDKLEHLPSMMAITQLLQPPPPAYSQTESSTPSQSTGKEVEVPAHFGALRLIELADRPSDVMKSSATDALLHTDPLLAIFRTFAELNGLPVSSALSIVPFDTLATSVGEHARAQDAQLVLVPWLPSAQAPEITDAGAAQDRSPFDSLFLTDRSSHSHFVRGVFAHAGTNVALLIGRAPFGVREQTHLFLPFFGGPDDRLALDFVVQLCANPRVCATVVRMTKHDIAPAPEATHLTALAGEDKVEDNAQANGMTIASVKSVSTAQAAAVVCGPSSVADMNPGGGVWRVQVTGFPDTMYGNATTQTRLQSETADGITWARYATPSATNDTALGGALSRVTFEELADPAPLHAALHRVRTLQSPIVVVGRSRRLAVENHHAELRTLEEEHGAVRTDVRKTVGDVGTAFVMAGVDVNLLVMQAPGTHLD